MQAELVFNDRSVAQAVTPATAQGWFTDMMQAVADLIATELAAPVLHSNLDLYAIDLIQGHYGFQEWVAEEQTDSDLRRLAWELTTRTPVNRELLASARQTDDFERSDYLLEDNSVCTALGVALAWDGIAVSLPSEQRWRTTAIAVRQHLFEPDLDPNHYQVVHHQVPHVSQPAHVDPVETHWRQAAGRRIASTEALVTHWSSLFPRLDLCLEHQHTTLTHLGDPNVRASLIERLMALDTACAAWQNSPSGQPTYGFRARPESRATMAADKRAQQRRATCPQRGAQEFVMHADLQPKGYRLYWFENTTDRRICIGYVGPHLETVKHKAQ